MKNLTNKTLLVLGGLLLIMVGISSGCIGGKGDGGGTDSDVTSASGAGDGVAVQQNEINPENTESALFTDGEVSEDVKAWQNTLTLTEEEIEQGMTLEN